MLSMQSTARVQASRSVRVASAASSRSATTMAMAPGQKVKVKDAISVYHVPKTKGAETKLEGMQGVVDTVRVQLLGSTP